MIVEVDGKRIDSSFCIFDGNTFQIFPTWKDGDRPEDGKMSLDIHDNDIEKIIVVRKE